MNIFKKIFGTKKDDDSKSNLERRGKFMPEIKLPIDEKFTINFKKNGGKFLYCESLDEIHECFDNILEENDWNNQVVCCFEDRLKKKFGKFNLNFKYDPSSPSSFFLTSCENLVADSGAILISSNQIKEERLFNLPDNFIVYATTSQLVNTIGEGLKGIKSKNRNKIPTNITTIKHFNIKEEKDFLTYGSSSKNLYLLLLEDL